MDLQCPNHFHTYRGCSEQWNDVLVSYNTSDRALLCVQTPQQLKNLVKLKGRYSFINIIERAKHFKDVTFKVEQFIGKDVLPIATRRTKRESVTFILNFSILITNLSNKQKLGIG